MIYYDLLSILPMLPVLVLKVLPMLPVLPVLVLPVLVREWNVSVSIAPYHHAAGASLIAGTLRAPKRVPDFAHRAHRRNVQGAS